MSIILKGIDLPKEEFKKIDVAIYGNGAVIVKGESIAKTISEMLGGTQAIQIPKGHGDIKDMDTVDTWGWERPCEQSLENAPTILEAEE